MFISFITVLRVASTRIRWWLCRPAQSLVSAHVDSRLRPIANFCSDDNRPFISKIQAVITLAVLVSSSATSWCTMTSVTRHSTLTSTLDSLLLVSIRLYKHCECWRPQWPVLTSTSTNSDTACTRRTHLSWGSCASSCQKWPKWLNTSRRRLPTTALLYAFTAWHTVHTVWHQ